MPGKQLSFLICTFLCISFSLKAQDIAPQLSAALCEKAYWDCSDKAGRDSLLIQKAAFLAASGEYDNATQTLGRVSNFGLDSSQRAELLRRKLIYTYNAGNMDEFCGLLDEAAGYGLTDGVILKGKPRHRSEDAAMILSVLPGVGLAYAGDWGNAVGYFFLNSSIIALDVFAFSWRLYASAILGGGMLLSHTLPRSTNKAVEAASAYNSRALKEYYAPVYEALISY